jgi:hypothetical protein
VKQVVLALMIATASPLAAQAAPRVTTPLPAAELAALESLRASVWEQWFTGDTAALRRVLAPELVAIGTDAHLWRSLDETLAASAGYKASGARFVSVAFDNKVTHHFGNTVVMFSRYSVITENKGERRTQTGHATEVFVRSGGRWVHTSWQLDVAP